MTSTLQVRDAIMGAFRAAWLASPTTSSIPLRWAGVIGDEKPGEQTGGAPPEGLAKALPWARASMVHLDGTQETFAAVGQRRYLMSGIFTVQLFTPLGDGHALSDLIVAVVKSALRARYASFWFNNVRQSEVGVDGPWFNVNVDADFFYQERE